jgi:hydroxymethylpyrimidine kinase/phosphomethylpyrimidine kinase
MVATSGSQLLPKEAVSNLRKHLLPLTTILTPNIPEARLILSDAGNSVGDPHNVEDLINIAKALQSLGPKYVLVKGGHVPFRKNGMVATTEAEYEVVINILYGDDQVIKFEHGYQNTKNTHGTGCSLACELILLRLGNSLNKTAAIASNLANDLDLPTAVKRACKYVEVGIKTASDLGHGNGPLNHFHSTYTLPFSP